MWRNFVRATCILACIASTAAMAGPIASFQGANTHGEPVTARIDFSSATFLSLSYADSIATVDDAVDEIDGSALSMSSGYGALVSLETYVMGAGGIAQLDIVPNTWWMSAGQAGGASFQLFPYAIMLGYGSNDSRAQPVQSFNESVAPGHSLTLRWHNGGGEYSATIYFTAMPAFTVQTECGVECGYRHAECGIECVSAPVAAEVPEPSPAMLMLAAVLAAIAARKRDRHRAAAAVIG